MQVEVGAVLEGKVTGITKFGAFVELPDKKTGMVHISEEGKISLSMKKALPPAPRQSAPRRPAFSGRPDDVEWSSSSSRSGSFEDMMSRFKAASDEKISDLKRSMDSKHGGFSRKTPRGGQQ